MRITDLKLKEVFTGLAVTAVAGATLQGGNAHAVLNCTFGSIGACNGTLGNVTFSGFSLDPSSSGYLPADSISIVRNGNSYTVFGNYLNPATGDTDSLAGSGRFSFTASTINGSRFLSAETDSTTTGSGFTFTNSLSGFTPSPLVSIDGTPGNTVASSGLTSTNVVVDWSAQNNSTALTSSVVLDTDSKEVPAPLPLFGAAAAFSFSRRLRQRRKALL